MRSSETSARSEGRATSRISKCSPGRRREARHHDAAAVAKRLVLLRLRWPLPPLALGRLLALDGAQAPQCAVARGVDLGFGAGEVEAAVRAEQRSVHELDARRLE